jgi:hypothetical protein
MTVVVKFTRPSTSVPWYSESSPEAAAQYEAFKVERAARKGFVSHALISETPDGLSQTYSIKWETTADRLAYDPQFFADRAAYNLLHGIVFDTKFIDDAAVAKWEAQKAAAAKKAAAAAAKVAAAKAA